MKPHEIIVQANAEIERLKTENGDLQVALVSCKATIESQRVEISHHREQISIALAERDDLSLHVTHMMVLMDEGIAASKAGAEALAQGIEREWSQRAQEIMVKISRLQEEAATSASKAETSQMESSEKIKQLGAEIITKTLELNDSNRRIRLIDEELKAVTKTFETLAAAQSDLFRNHQESTLQTIKEQNQKSTRRTNWLATQLAEANTRLLENDRLKEVLYEKGKAEQEARKLLQQACEEAETLLGHSAQRLYISSGAATGICSRLILQTPREKMENISSILSSDSSLSLAQYLSYFDLIPKNDEDRWEILGSATQHILDYQKQRPWDMLQDKCLMEEDREFLGKVMKPDPRDRPTAKEFLEDKWFDGVP